MKKIHSEIYLGKTIDVFREYNDKYFRYDYTVQIDGKDSNFKESRNSYATIGRATMVAKRSIKRDMSVTKKNANKITVAELKKQLEILESMGMGNYSVWFRDDNSIDYELERGLWDTDEKTKSVMLG